MPVNILAVTSWGGACGVANYCEMLMGALPAEIHMEPFKEALDPEWLFDHWSRGQVFRPDAVWLNYHRGLHSRWTAAQVHRVQNLGIPVAITFHDTYGEADPDALTQSLYQTANAFVVHEPCEGLPKQVLIRQGVPAATMPMVFDQTVYKAGYIPKQPDQMQNHMRAPRQMPVLGTVGFNFPWKNFDRLAEVTAEAGWAYFVASNNATDADVARWTAANPWTFVLQGFQPTDTLVRWLSACDATCFAYECANSGTSGAIRLGLAARKPVIAWSGCRQFDDLKHDKPGRSAIMWCSGFEYLIEQLGVLPIQRVDPGIAYLAHRDSWTHQAAKYAAVFRGLIA
jgi:hypothetical protein